LRIALQAADYQGSKKGYLLQTTKVFDRAGIGLGEWLGLVYMFKHINILSFDKIFLPEPGG
jgi:hypothetical protein